MPSMIDAPPGGDGPSAGQPPPTEPLQAHTSLESRTPLQAHTSLEKTGVSGLSLIKALLPRRGARLRIEALGPVVRASLDLAPPAIREEAE
ncbi:signal transduction histidine kinase [Burkholderiales bacterium GJ-E10]|nr:signal transduction histidine kinase [Burkholderiales bacterium GJ-E10]